MGEKKTVPVTRLPAARARGLVRPIITRKGSRVSIEPALPPRSKGPGDRPWEPAGSIDVEQLVVWAFRDQKADRFASIGLYSAESSAEGITLQRRSSDGCGALADIEHLGCRIDRRSGLIKDQVHPAAEAVAVIAGEIDGGELVRHYGRLGGRPEGWAEPSRWYRPVVWKVQGKEGQWERTGRGMHAPQVCYVIPTITRDELARRRQVYAAWWEALDQLAWQLSMRALGFSVLAPSAPPAPWSEPELPL